MKKRLILWLVLLVIGFLLGFVPQYWKRLHSDRELAAAQQQVASCQLVTAVSQLKDTAAMLYLEATRQNYGTAGQYSSRLFQRIQQVSVQNIDPALRATLQQFLQSRDAITAALAKGDPAVVSDLQPLLQKLDGGTAQ